MTSKESPFKWSFLASNDGAFVWPEADSVSRLYFPLMNTHGMKCSVTPELKGDVAAAFHQYLTAATVTEELHRNVSSRNFWIKIENQAPWSVGGVSAFQRSVKWTGRSDAMQVIGRPGAFGVHRSNETLGISSEVTVFVPTTDDLVEIMIVTLTNISSETIRFTPWSSSPIFGRHADNFRDHRQVTTMFQKVFTEEHGVRVKPSIVHDEHGHQPNRMNYAVLGFGANGDAPVAVWPVMADFIGEGGSLDNPEAVFKGLYPPDYAPGDADGREAVGAMRYAEAILEAGQRVVFVVLHGITSDEHELDTWKQKYGSEARALDWLQKTLQYWRELTSSVSFHTGDSSFDNWMRWIIYQVKSRQVFGNSFLPDFGYGRGGRGWRDLWQDLLSIFLVNPSGARDEMLNNFKGVRVDGSNATIVGANPGEFKADRNNVPRSWCDHGAWPLLVVDFYLHQTGDLDFLLLPSTYWKDQFCFRNTKTDPDWTLSQGNQQRDVAGNVVTGSVLEHLLLQQLSAFYNVGSHNNLLLEGGDWNDTLDMARENGESVCFHSFYGENMNRLANLLAQISPFEKGSIMLMNEMLPLLDQLPGQKPVDYDNPAAKQLRLKSFFTSVEHTVSGNKTRVAIEDLRTDLQNKARHIQRHIARNEWLSTDEHYHFFNGHYDNNGFPLHGQTPRGAMMDLTSQVIPVINQMATDSQIEELWKSVNHYLKDDNAPGLRLCTPFKELDLSVGRITGFAYGFKEHGSKWMQQNIMLMHGLYQAGHTEKGFSLLQQITELCYKSEKALIFPGIPSYFEPGDRGAYAYLTGSSAWLLLSLTTMVFGVTAHFGNLLLRPALHSSQFDASRKAILTRNFRDLRLQVDYLRADDAVRFYNQVNQVLINGFQVDSEPCSPGQWLIPYQKLTDLNKDGVCHLVVFLS